MSNGRVDILLATYNGEKYLDEQIASIFDQTYQDIRLLIRDDGSSDRTLSLIFNNHIKDNVVFLDGKKNLGAAGSFFELLKHSDPEAQFFAFCDQDDIWYPDKLDRAVKALSEISKTVPVMYFTRLELVDENNDLIKPSDIPRHVGFGNALIENIATGCTLVMNQAARNIIVSALPSRCLMHDSWCYLVISAFGEIIYDAKPSIRYRQHSNNAIGAATTNINNLVRRIKRFNWNNKNTFRFSDQAKCFYALFGKNISSDKQHLVFTLLSAKTSLQSRIKLIFNRKIKRQKSLDDLAVRILILLNRF